VACGTYFYGLFIFLPENNKVVQILKDFRFLYLISGSVLHLRLERIFYFEGSCSWVAVRLWAPFLFFFNVLPQSMK